MTEETERHTIRLLREIRSAQTAAEAKLEAFMAAQQDFNAKTDSKLDKLTIEVVGVKGRIRKMEEAVEAIARVISDGVLG